MLDHINCGLIINKMSLAKRLSQMRSKLNLLLGALRMIIIDYFAEVVAHRERWEAELIHDKTAVCSLSDSWSAKKNEILLSGQALGHARC